MLVFEKKKMMGGAEVTKVERQKEKKEKKHVY